MNKQVLFLVTLVRSSSSVGSLEVPVTINTSKPNCMKAAKSLAYMKAVDAVNRKITLASDIHWTHSDEAPSFIRLKDVELINDPEPPEEVYSLLCSNILAIVKEGHLLGTYVNFNDRAKKRLKEGIRWLNLHHDELPEGVVERLNMVKAMLQDMDAPDELIRGL